jgi:acyl dehydratase
MVTLNGIEGVKEKVGEEIGVSEWHEVTQDAIDTFAEVTGDDQWIHVDPERAKETPFGGTIAHGFYTLSLIPKFTYAMFTVENIAFALNYGLNRVRFPAPLPVGQKVRMRATISQVDDITGGIQMTVTATLETEGGEKPVCVAETLTRMYTGG